MLPIFFAVASFFSTIFGGVLALRFKDKLHLILAFASGAVVSTALFELLPEIIRLGNEQQLTTRNLMAFSVVGFLLFHIVERILIFSNCQEASHQKEGCQHVGIFSATGFSFHSFFDGLGIGLGFLASFQLGIVMAAAVLAHDFSDGLNTATVILKNQGSSAQAFWWVLLNAVAPLAGVLFSFAIKSSSIMPYVVSFYFGFFLYLGASDLLPEAHHRHSSYLTIVATILGFAFVYLVSGLLGGMG